MSDRCPWCNQRMPDQPQASLAAVADPVSPARKARRGDYATAKAAAVLAWPRAGIQRRRALDVIAASPDGLTTEQVADKLDGRYQSFSTRLSELAEAGWVEDSGRRRNTSSRTPAIVWVATEQARRALADERAGVAA